MIIPGGDHHVHLCPRLAPEEGNKLVKIARKGSNPVEVRRALVVLASAQKMKVPEISEFITSLRSTFVILFMPSISMDLWP